MIADRAWSIQTAAYAGSTISTSRGRRFRVAGNPTLTIVALALRLGDHWLRRLER
ncbi:MAG: hypothetical protein ABIX28_18565 [Vicinamibacterales bacterium]